VRIRRLNDRKAIIRNRGLLAHAPCDENSLADESDWHVLRILILLLPAVGKTHDLTGQLAFEFCFKSLSFEGRGSFCLCEPADGNSDGCSRFFV